MKPLSVSIGQFFKRRYVKCNVYDEYGDNYERISTFWVRLGTKKHFDSKHKKTRIINLKKTIWDNNLPTLAYPINGSEPMSFEGNKGVNITPEIMIPKE